MENKGTSHSHQTYVLDTNSILQTDLPYHLAEEAARHMLILPKKLYEELGRLGREGACRHANNILQMVNTTEASRRQGNAARRGGDGVKFFPGVRLHTAKEKDNNVLSSARNNDGHILSCACYFHRHLKGVPVYFITADEVLSLKAYAEGVIVKKSFYKE